MPLDTIRNMFRSAPVEEPTTSAPSAPEEAVVEATVEPTAADAKNNFEWNVGRLYSADPAQSKTRTWAVRVLSTLLVFPVVLTALLDIGRRMAFSAGLVDGKSWSLIDKASQGVQSLSARVSQAYQSLTQPKVLTLEEKNEQIKNQIGRQTEKLIDGYKGLNGGLFHTNSSFSSPHALKSEKQIARAQEALRELINDYVSLNATSTEDFVEVTRAAEGLVWDSINAVAGDEYYIENKIERNGEPEFLRRVAREEFFDKVVPINRPILAEKFIALAQSEPKFALALSQGVDAKVLTRGRAQDALEGQVRAVFNNGLETGLESAEEAVQDLNRAAIVTGLLSENEALFISDGIEVPVEVLAAAAAKDVARNQTDQTTDADEVRQLTQAAKGLREKNRLEAEDESTFINVAREQINQARAIVAAEDDLLRVEAEELEAQRAQEVLKLEAQETLLNTFSGMLSLIQSKQAEMNAQFDVYRTMEVERESVTNQLVELRSRVVTVHGHKMNVLQAASEYYRAVGEISRNKRLTSQQKKQEISDLSNHGFSQQTIDRINELKDLEPRVKEVIDNMAVLASEIEAKHEEILKLNAMFKVFKRNNFAGLEQNRAEIESVEKRVRNDQTVLNRTFVSLIERKDGLMSRLRAEERVVLVNLDPQGNREEVDALVKAFAQGEVELPKARSYVTILKHGMQNAFGSLVSRLFRSTEAA